MLVCVYYCAFGTRDRGCSRHPAFPAPSVWRGPTNLQNLGRNLPREREGMLCPHVVPANAGTTNHTGSAIEYFTWLNAKLDSIEAIPSSRVSLFFKNAS